MPPYHITVKGNSETLHIAVVHNTWNKNSAPPNITKYVYPLYLESLAVLTWRRVCPIRGRGPPSPSPDNFKMGIVITIIIQFRAQYVYIAS